MRRPFRILLLAASFFPLACQAGPDAESSDAPETRSESSELLAASCHDPRTQLVLPSPRHFPEGVAVGPDGAFYVGSMGTGAIVRFAPGSSVAETLVPPREAFGNYGLHVDTRRNKLWSCTYDDNLLPAQPAYLNAYDLGTGALEGSHVMPGTDGFCNDLTLDARGNVYATDSLAHTIVVLRPGANRLATWSSSPLLGADPGEIGVNGIAVDRYRNRLIAGNMFRNTLVSIPLRWDGSPGEAEVIAIEPPVEAPDGVEFVDADTLVVPSFNKGTVSLVKLSDNGRRGVQHIIATGLAQPATAAIYRGSAWVAISQGRKMSSGEPVLPFIVQRFPIPNL